MRPRWLFDGPEVGEAPPAREWLAAFALCSLVLLAQLWSAVDAPYWWDAGAVYAPGARWLEQHHFDLRPGVFPSDLHRGHTRFFYLVLAAAYRLFGSAPRVGNGVVLLSSALCLTLTYGLGRRLGGRMVGALSVALLCFAPLYLSMSAQALPEVPLAALTVGALYALAAGSTPLAALCCVLLVHCKETGLAGLAACAAALAWSDLRARRYRAGLARQGWMSLAGLSLLGFFLWQRRGEGWFVLPYHDELLRESHPLGEQSLRVARSMVLSDGRFVALAGAVVLGGLRPHLRPSQQESSPPGSVEESSPPGPLSLKGEGEAKLAGAWGVLHSPLSLQGEGGWGGEDSSRRGRGGEDSSRRGRGGEDSSRGGEVRLAILFTALFNQLFFTKMFFLERYALPAHPGLAVLLALALWGPAGSSRARRGAGVACVALCALLALRDREAGRNYASGETTLRYLHAVRAQRRIVQDLEARGGDPAVLSEWPVSDALREPWLGFGQRAHRTITWSWHTLEGRDGAEDEPLHCVLTFDALGAHAGLLREARARRLALVAREREGYATFELYCPPAP